MKGKGVINEGVLGEKRSHANAAAPTKEKRRGGPALKYGWKCTPHAEIHLYFVFRE
jgi:hypothetical protein